MLVWDSLMRYQFITKQIRLEQRDFLLFTFGLLTIELLFCACDRTNMVRTHMNRIG